MLAKSVLMALLANCAPHVAADTMLALVMAESAGNPWHINVNTKARLLRQPQSEAEAVAAARALEVLGASYDAGLAQVNSANFPRLGLTAESVFSPCRNLAAGAGVLQENYSAALKLGHSRPLDAALSLYNTGSMSRGLVNGYVAKVRGQSGASAPGALPWSPRWIGDLLVSRFGGRVTDMLRPQNAGYGATNSYHKRAQAVDFVPEGGAAAVPRAELRRTLEEHGIAILELLGPGDPDHDDHWHVAFDRAGAPSTPDDDPPLSIPISGPMPAAPPPPPAEWDVFAYHAWKEARHEAE